MSTVATPLTSWEDFLLIPYARNGERYELRDGEVTVVPPARPRHVYLQIRFAKQLTETAKDHGSGAQEFPYRPARNLQLWYADVAYIPNDDLQVMNATEYSIYSPPLIIEILSPSNRPEEINRKRVAAFSCGTREFWLVDSEAQTIEVSMPGAPTRVFKAGDYVPVASIPGALLDLSRIF
jgi:Uma2 family endonuclease